MILGFNLPFPFSSTPSPSIFSPLPPLSLPSPSPLPSPFSSPSSSEIVEEERQLTAMTQRRLYAGMQPTPNTPEKPPRSNPSSSSSLYMRVPSDTQVDHLVIFLSWLPYMEVLSIT